MNVRPELSRVELFRLAKQVRWTGADIAEARRLIKPLKDPRDHWGDEIWTAVSDDGIIWHKEHRRVVENANKHEVIQLPDGRVLLYYIDIDLERLVAEMEAGTYDLTAGGLAGADYGIRCMVSDDGLTFRQEPAFRLTGLIIYGIFAPTVAPLGGGRLRMWMVIRAPGRVDWPEGKAVPRALFSATSTDGVRWTMERGVRWQNPPGVVRVRRWPDGTMHAFGHSGEGATSLDDGLTFEEWHPPIPVPTINPCPVPVPGGIRLFYGVLGEGFPETPNRIGGRVASSFSADGGTWQEEPGYRLTEAFQPAVIALPGGGYRMYYVGVS
ncbi:MAG: hypothetical protein U0556_05115 [Dehalococcoidia bacterium]